MIADVRRVPDSPWFLVTRMDVSEVYAPMRVRQWQIVVLIGVLLFGAAAGVTLIWQRSARTQYKALLEVEKARGQVAHDLEASETRYRRLFEAAKDGILILDADTGQIVDVNPYLVELLGYPREEFLGKYLWDIGLFKDIAASKDSLEELKAREYVRYDDLSLETRDGRKINVEFVSNVYRVDNAKVIQCNIRNITERKQAEERLRASEQEFRALAEAMPQIVWATRPDGWNTYFNQQWVDYTGLTQEESRGAGWNTPFHPDDQQRAMEAWQRATQNGDIYALECRLRRADGAYRWWLVRGVPLRDASGKVLKWFGTCTDIEDIKHATEETRRLLEQGDRDRLALLGILEDQKRSEQALKENTTFLNTLLNAIPVPVFYKDTEGRYTGFNKAFEAFYGKRHQELVGKSVFDIAPRELAEVYHAKDLELFRNPGVQVYDAKMKDGQGKMHDVVYHKATFTDAGGKVSGLIGAILDITERNRNEEEIRRVSTFLDSIIENIPNMIFLKDAEELRFVRFNKAGEELLGQSRGHLIGKNDYDFFPREQADHFVAKDREVLAGGGVLDIPEEPLQTKDRGVRFLHTKKLPIADKDGKPLYLLGISEDITDRKQAEEAVQQLNEELEQRVLDRTAQLEAANKELESFSYSVSHDLRAPLRSIDGFSQAVLEESEKQLSESTLGNLRRVRAAAQQMSRLIDGMLGLARLTRREMRRREVDMGPIAAELVRTLRKTDTGRQVEVEIGKDLVVHGDPDMLKIVVQNLIENAWKFTGKTEKARIEFGVMEQGSDGVMGHPNTPELQNSKTQVFFVRDNGAGFDPAYAGKLFGAFQRLHAESEFSGTGLGLASVQRILLRHGGRIWAEGAVGKGATFYFTV